jgi:hypothetical protein
MKKIICITLVLTIIISLFGCNALGGAQATQPASTASSSPSAASLSPSPSATAAQSASPAATLSLVPSASPSASGADTGLTYQNAEYGFTFSLPATWKGYTIVNSKWEGTIQDSTGNNLAKTGPELLIRHPKWTEKNPWQDIPIMIFTPAQWTDVQADKLHIGAAPINPTELGHNSKYVFALPARYNYAYPTGFEEVDSLLKTNPLHANEDIGDVS